MSIEQTVKEVFQQVLDVEPNEINPDEPLQKGLGVDSTEMVEISVALKKRLGVSIADNELKKTHSLKQIVQILQSKYPSLQKI